MAKKNSKSKKEIGSLTNVAKSYGGKKGGGTGKLSSQMIGSYNFKNFGLDDLAQAIFKKQQSGVTRVGVYVNKRQAEKYADVIKYAKSIGVDVGVAKAGSKNRPYDLLVGSSRPKTSATTTGDDAQVTATGISTSDLIAQKIFGGLGGGNPYGQRRNGKRRGRWQSG